MNAVLQPKDNRLFQIDCSAEPTGSFRAGADRLSLRIGQRIRRLGAEEIWDSVIVEASNDGDDLTLRVLLCHPDWDEPIEIACIRSGRDTARPCQSIGCHPEQVIIEGACQLDRRNSDKWRQTGRD
jgi:hypothetical protein